MNHTKNNNMQHDPQKKYSFKDFLPLITIFALIIAFTLVRQWYAGWNLALAMRDFMGAFFIVFGSFKLLNLKGFAEAYATYDIIAQKNMLYAYAYPFIEVALGIAYFYNYRPTFINTFTLILMLVSSIGVAIELGKNKPIMCACLGVVFKIPMTYVTLVEDLLMAAMALYMLFNMSYTVI